MAEGGQQQAQAPEAGNRDVVDAHAGLIAQIANSRRVGLVSDHFQRRTRQIKSQRVTCQMRLLTGKADYRKSTCHRVLDTPLNERASFKNLSAIGRFRCKP
ncbi:hypothetical protein V1281_004287 [Nitrobacteraceae bacterium AZCC 2161]